MEVQEENDEFRDHVSHISEGGKRVWFFPKKVSGKYYNLRSYLSWAYLATFFSLPFIQIHGQPLFMFNIIDRVFILFGVRFWPQDFFIFVLGMLIFVIFIVLFTIIYGRIFCGWVCPQTIFMEMIFRKIEYLIDGDRNEQIALNKRPWDAYKIRKRATKIISFFILSFVIANFFLMYILGSKEVLNIIFEPIELHITGLVLIFVFSFVFFFVYYWFREQVCLIVCPYGRLQSVMLDKNSITVAYDHVRGEPRTKNFKKSDNHGSCVDCFECVRVCPTGIDIRNGIQLECINCTACMDICDQVMDKTHQPKGLIRYASVNSVIDGKKLHITKRIFSYSLVLVVLIALEAFLLATRSDVEINTMRTRNTLFTTEKDGTIGNLFNVKLINKTNDTLYFNFRIEGQEAHFDWVGHKQILGPQEMKNGELFIYLPANALSGSKTKILLQVLDGEKIVAKEKLNFIGPNTHHQ